MEPTAECIVIVTVDAEPDVLADMERHARRGLSVFGTCDGFVSGALHRSLDDTRLVQLLRWSNRGSYERARDDPQWDDLDTTGPFFAHIAAGRATVDPRIVAVVAEA